MYNYTHIPINCYGHLITEYLKIVFETLTEKFSDVFKRLIGTHKLTEKNIQEAIQKINDALIDADVPYNVVQQFIQQVSTQVTGQRVLKNLSPSEHFIKVIHDQLIAFLSTPAQIDLEKIKTPSTILVVGLQGSGKTTTIGKLAHWLKSKKTHLQINCASLDFYRPAARQQLEILAQNAGINYYQTQQQTAIKAVHEIAQQATIHADITLLDTAGRLHVDQDLMDELHTIKTVSKPTHTLLVLDAMTGQQSLAVAQAFQETIGIDAIILSKIDSDARAGAAFACTYCLKKPILFTGTGEKLDDLESFHPQRIATRILGMGDISSLIEKAQAHINAEEQETAMKKMMSGSFTLDDFAKQMDMVSRLGSLGSLIKYLPGISSIDRTTLEKGEQEIRIFRVIINSMTPKERQKPSIINHSRMQRIATGAGVQLTAIRSLMVKFEQSKQFVKLLNRQ